MNLLCNKCGASVTKKGFDTAGKQRYMCIVCGHRTVHPKEFQSDKKQGSTDWREWSENCIERQNLHEKASSSQDVCNIFLKTDKPFIIYQPLADLHIGNIGTSYKDLIEWTDQILQIPELYFSVMGDLADKFSAFKNMLAVHQMILSPEEQDKFIESWVEETQHKFLFSTWGNHEEMEERASGQNAVKNILNKKLVYFNGIGVANLHINDIKYKIVATHKTRANSCFNKTHGLKRLARENIPDGDIYVAGHNHTGAFEFTEERSLWQVFIKLCSLKKNDGYAKRYFTYFCDTTMPNVVLNTQKHEFTPFRTLSEALQFIKRV